MKFFVRFIFLNIAYKCANFPNKLLRLADTKTMRASCEKVILREINFNESNKSTN